MKKNGEKNIFPIFDGKSLRSLLWKNREKNIFQIFYTKFNKRRAYVYSGV